MVSENRMGLEARIKDLALAVGFDLAGIALARPTPQTEFLREWVERGYAGEMGWIPRRLEERIDPRRIFDGVESIVAVGLVYDPGGTEAPGPSGGEISRYARGEDYHDVLLDRLEALGSGLEALARRPVRSRAYVDTGPVQERVYAWLGGLGWIGKNACLIHPRLGSYLFLGVLLTDLALVADAPEPDHCGTCRACLDACPTDAFVAPRVLDARLCLSYTTIELRDAIPEALREPQADRLFGCDVCQEVCPWNERRGREIPPDPLGLRARLRPRPEWVRPALEWVLDLDEAAWRDSTRGMALRRAKRRGLLRNALVAAGNSGDQSLVPALRRHAEGADPLLADHARWALRRLSGLSVRRSPGQGVPGSR
jgi:epoxyqueuosine reductase